MYVSISNVPTLSAFEHFGEMLKNKYIYKEYIIWKNSNIQNKDISIGEYKNKQTNLYKEMEEDNFNIYVGGFFVWCLVTTKLLGEEMDYVPDAYEKTGLYLRVP